MKKTISIISILLLFALSCENTINDAMDAAEETYLVTYFGNGNTGGVVPVDTREYKTGETITTLTKGTLVRTSFTFVGWNTKADGTGTNYAQGVTFVMGSADVTLYAKWSSDPTFTVTYNPNSATSGNVPTDPNNYLQGNTVNVLGNTGVPPLARTGYSFSGWSLVINGSQVTSFTMGMANVILYAKWSINQYTVTFNTDGGSSVAPQTIAYGGLVTQPAAPSRGGCPFEGWYKEAACTNAWNFSTDTVTSATTLYAKWHVYALRDTGPAGGLIFYDKGSFSDGWRYMEAAPSNNGAYPWGTIANTIPGADGTAIGTGYQNTIDIVNGDPWIWTTAADTSWDVVIGIYSDWFLPSKEELNLMFTNLYLNGVGGFVESIYWSSSEANASYAWIQYFNSGVQNYYGKNSVYYVRAVRAF